MDKDMTEPAAASVDWLLQTTTKQRPEVIARARPAQIRMWLSIAERQLTRERNKGLARHWSYNLNRHIALKAARDRLAHQLGGAPATRS